MVGFKPHKKRYNYLHNILNKIDKCFKIPQSTNMDRKYLIILNKYGETY